MSFTKGIMDLNHCLMSVVRYACAIPDSGSATVIVTGGEKGDITSDCVTTVSRCTSASLVNELDKKWPPS